MTIVNRRNAVVGWLTLKTGKVVARRKMRRVGGMLTFWRPGNGAKSTGRAKQSA
jgi:hypothetical protein